MARDLRALPKVHLHVHLEGAMRPSTVRELAARHGVPLPDGIREAGYRFADFRHFIEQWMAGLHCLQRPQEFRRIAYEFCEDQAADGVRYAEVSFSLPEHGSRLADWDAPLLSVLDGFAGGERDFGIVCRPYVDIVRGLPTELSRLALESAIRHLDEGVIGIGLGGSEEHLPESYERLFHEALDHGLHSLPHAGETAGPPSIRGAIDALKAERIGHGIRVLEDRALTEELRDRMIPIDVCPTSNVKTRVVGAIGEHPLLRLLEAGLIVTLNADDPAMFGTTLTQEYELARAQFGLDDDALAGIARASVQSSFAEPELKSSLEAGIDAWMDRSG